jgi:hypothetical protein
MLTQNQANYQVKNLAEVLIPSAVMTEELAITESIGSLYFGDGAGLFHSEISQQYRE